MDGKPTAPLPQVEPMGDAALVLRFGDTLDPAVNARVHAAARRLAEAALPDVIDRVPAYATLTLVLAPDSALRPEDLARVVHRLLRDEGGTDVAAARTVIIPVSYGGTLGEDLAVVARHAGIDADAVVRRHAAGDYRVAQIGFLPGFPYLLGLDPALATPRRATPRVRVPAGSVAIGGAQTGIYPSDAPGGWQLIGRTSAVLFDAARTPPTLLRPGDRVRFLAVPPDRLSRTPVEIVDA